MSATTGHSWRFRSSLIGALAGVAVALTLIAIATASSPGSALVGAFGMILWIVVVVGIVLAVRARRGGDNAETQ